MEKIAGEVCVRFKEYMHSELWCGLRKNGDANADAPPHQIFAFEAPTFQEMPDFKLKQVPDQVIALIEQRNSATLQRLEAAYALGKKRVLPS